MIESKHIILVVLCSGLLFQYFKYRNVPSHKFLPYLSYFEKLSLVNKEVSGDTRFLIGFESIKYFIVKNLTISDNEDLRKSFCFSEIVTEDEFQCALFKASRNDYNQKYFVKNETLFKSILSHSTVSTSQRLAGSGVNFARQLAYLKNTEVMLVSKIEKSSLRLLPNNIKVSGVLDGHRKSGLRRTGLIALYSDRRKAVFDRAGLKGFIDDFQLVNVSLLQEVRPHCLVIGRLPPMRLEQAIDPDRVAMEIEGISRVLGAVPAGVAIHHQLGRVDSAAAGQLLVKHLVPHLDSIDLGLLELHQLHGLVREGRLASSLGTASADAVRHSSDVATSVGLLDELWAILSSGSFSARAGTRKISRIHLRAHDYHVLMMATATAPQQSGSGSGALFYGNLRHALAKGLMAQLQARCHRKMSVLREIVHFHLEDEFFHHHNHGNNATLTAESSLIECWSVRNQYEICVSPVPTCLEVKHSLDEGEATAAAALAAQIRVHH